ncbi:shikimate kinase [Paenibacillus sacheonensis]|uniref:Shikimate kinase n=1 Tax=Paenibacillus sacheonensis TaxID=742054 RepID=A0A7X4YRE3_9BACL|nr:shikimate kinase [Paenibacillus sacheonensis]MBM7563563.1 shikimate kinase [Paenibacillus sacheonensis]NBC71138.1 AAA family ATPase [Paenibacillus sacheonensis]
MSDDQPLQHVVLIGFMGTGKSTVSKRLAEHLGCAACDVDAEIVKREREEIASIFASRGEEAFRAAETAALDAVLGAQDKLVIATGGGAVLSSVNRELMLRKGYVVALTAHPERVIARVSQDPDRPLLQGGVRERVYKLLEDRKHAYDFAHLTIDTTDLTVDEIVNRIAEAAARNGQHSNS